MAKQQADKEKAGKAPKPKAAAAEPAPSHAPDYVPRLFKRYREKVLPGMKEKFGYANIMMVPTIEKVVVNMGIGAAIHNPKLIESAVADLRQLTGQQPVVRKARKSIASFKLRQGQAIGAKVTLRAARMWEFIDRLVSLALPRVRDFKGVSPKGFDGRGNFTMGIREQTVFPEIDYDKVDAVKGMNISFVTTAMTNEEGRELLRQLGMPFRGMAVEVN